MTESIRLLVIVFRLFTIAVETCSASGSGQWYMMRPNNSIGCGSLAA